MSARLRSPSAVALVALASALGCGGSEFGSAGNGVGKGGASSADNGGGAGITSSGSGGSSSSGGAGQGGASAAGAPSGGSSAGGAPGGGAPSGGQAGSAAGGAPSSTIQLVTAYDRACKFDTDCLMVAEGDVCGCPPCHNAAIALTAQATWDADRKKIYCPVSGTPVACPAIACRAMLPACVNNLCVARPEVVIDAASYDATCRADSDCNLIYVGEVCSTCGCQTAAVNLGAYAKYQSDIAGVECSPRPAQCDCVAQTTVSCKVASMGALGACTIGP